MIATTMFIVLLLIISISLVSAYNGEVTKNNDVIEIGDKILEYISAFKTNGLAEDYSYNLDTNEYNFKLYHYTLKYLKLYIKGFMAIVVITNNLLLNNT